LASQYEAGQLSALSKVEEQKLKPQLSTQERFSVEFGFEFFGFIANILLDRSSPVSTQAAN
jgi:hypothetical protein